ncbi:TolC family protein [Taibaiella chishuiensis]|uniref:Outer membrane protein n=1 Tax=Taibaiella chishuiensis TaxID=1434707 RepID=A0A2P8CV72_9BACT|nr:TolC family protein [Taibaiella chishuiensis]PSK88873.1 outer membrane protein [Taibaiella chishuiensis]
MLKRIPLVFSLFIAGALQAQAQEQDSLWTLQRSVEYAVRNNLDIKQSVLNERLAKLQLQQSQLAQLPSASASGNYGRNFGRSIDPTSNQFIRSGYNFMGLNGNVDVLLFGWFQKRHTIERNRSLMSAATADLDQLKDDVSLNVATAFLRVLLAREQIGIARSQLGFSVKQMEQTKAFVSVGRSPELDLAQMESQVATDSSNYYSAQATYFQSLLDMKALMNFEIADPFVPLAPNVDVVPVTEVIGMKPEQIYTVAKDHFGSIKSGQYKYAAAKKAVDVSRAGLLPQISLGGQFGTNYASSYTEPTGVTVTGSVKNGDFVNINNNIYWIEQPTLKTDLRTIPFGTQIWDNFRQTVALSANIPLFNGWSTRTQIAQNRIDMASKGLNLEQTKLKLKQDVYKAYYDAMVAVQKYYAATSAAEASDRAFHFAEKRYELGLMNALELLTTQNNGYKAKSDALSAKYDLIFKLKVIDYYLGKELKL